MLIAKVLLRLCRAGISSTGPAGADGRVTTELIGAVVAAAVGRSTFVPQVGQNDDSWPRALPHFSHKYGFVSIIDVPHEWQ